MGNTIFDHRDPYEWPKRTASSSLPPLIVCVAITGGVHGKEANPNLPETPAEQVAQAFDCYRAGASMVHVHARDPQNWATGTGDPKAFYEINGLIREKCPDIILNLTTGGSYGQPFEERIKCLDAKPETASLNLGPEMYKSRLKARNAPLPNPREEIFLNDCSYTTYEEISRLARMMKDRGIRPEMELFHPGHYWVINDLISQSLVKKPYQIQFVLGSITASYATPWNLMNLIQELPADSIFSVSGMGPFQLPMTMMAIILGGHVRVGMEDNVYSRKGQLLQSNATAVEKIVRLAKDMNRDIATPVQAREMLGLSLTPSSY